jgi:hypothetical protein
MHETLKALIKSDADLPARARNLQVLDEFRTSAIYDRIKLPFHLEKTSGSEYVPLRNRRPSVRYGLNQIIVNDSTALLFSEAHFPAIKVTERAPLNLLSPTGEAVDFKSDDGDKDEKPKRKRGKKGAKSDRLRAAKNEDIATLMAALVKDTKLREVMLDAATRGSVGSIGIHFRVIKSRIFFKVMPTRYLTPTFDPDQPDVIARVTEKYKIKGSAVRSLGYSVNDDDKDRDFWFQRDWTSTDELWYVPWPVNKLDRDRGVSATPGKETDRPADTSGQQAAPQGAVDWSKSVAHGLGFVPIVWIKNLPGGDEIDGACTFEPAIDNSIEIDYQLSQCGRGLKYMSDPTLVIAEPPVHDDGTDGASMQKGPANALRLGSGATATLLEISGAGAAAVENYVRLIRELSLELCGGNRSSADKLSAAQSGRAMELMNQGLIWLADKLRTSYGEGGLVSLIRMVIRANETMPLTIAGQKVPKGFFGAADAAEIVLKWPPWYPPTLQDHANQANAMNVYRQSKVLSQETAVRQIAHDFDIEDPDQEIEQIKAEDKEAVDLAVQQAERTRPYEYQPNGKAPSGPEKPTAG